MSAGYERLTRLDETFLAFETDHAPMHVALTGIFDAAPLLDASGKVDLERIRRHVAARLHLIPRYRQCLAHVPLVHDTVWVDDQRFDLAYHVRHASLPRPGDERQLWRRCEEILERALDRTRPLWEMWVIEGVSGSRVALLIKVHHCMVDGVGGVELAATLLGLRPDEEIAAPPPWTPRPLPRGAELLRGELLRRVAVAADLGAGFGAAVREPARAVRAIGGRVAALGSLATRGLRTPARTPLNQRIGPHRRIQWLATDLEAVKTVKRALGGTVNDVVLATVAGGLRRFLTGRAPGAPPAELTVAVPVNVRDPSERGALGNRASVWMIGLPIAETDAATRLAAVRAATARWKASDGARGAAVLVSAAELTSGNVLHLAVRLLSRFPPYNLIVTNVPGPPVPLYLLGARMRAAYPYLPLFEHQGLGIALLSYGTHLFWGLTADWDLVPDLDRLASALETSFAELQALAAAATAGAATENTATEGTATAAAASRAEPVPDVRRAVEALRRTFDARMPHTPPRPLRAAPRTGGPH